MKRAMVPPKLQNSADRETSTKPMRSSRPETARMPTGMVCSLALPMMLTAAKQSPGEMLPAVNPSALFNAILSGVVQPRNPVVAKA